MAVLQVDQLRMDAAQVEGEAVVIDHRARHHPDGAEVGVFLHDAIVAEADILAGAQAFLHGGEVPGPAAHLLKVRLGLVVHNGGAGGGTHGVGVIPMGMGDGDGGGRGEACGGQFIQEELVVGGAVACIDHQGITVATDIAQAGAVGLVVVGEKETAGRDLLQHGNTSL